MNKMAPMASAKPSGQAVDRHMQLYYRHRRNGVIVFRMEVANRQRRIELNQIATISSDGEITPHARRTPTEAELTEIRAWWTDWTSRGDENPLNETEAFLVELNRFTDWVQRHAPDAQVDAHSDPLLMALLDLRQVVVRRLSKIGDDDA